MKPETFKVQGLTVAIHQDTDPTSPEENQDENAFLVTTKNRYFEVRPDWCQTPDNAEQLAETHYLYPVLAYIHSGVALSLSAIGQFSDPWDAGRIGTLAITKDASEIPFPQEYAEGMIEEWNQYLSGDVWGYTITRKGEQIDSCWGFFGIDYAREEATASAKAIANYRKAERLKIAAMMHL